ncbi:hypothetical protein ACXYMO_02570 [Arenibacterium sp. CAU 1754]
MLIRTLAFVALLPTVAAAQEPLSVIDWLGDSAPPIRSGPVLIEPPVTETALRPEVDVRPLEQQAAPVGLVPANVTGLPQDLWYRSDAKVLARLIREVSVSRSPAMQTLLYTLLLSETTPPQGSEAGETLLLARLDRLIALGAVDPAKSLVESAGPTLSTARFLRWFDAALLTGDEDSSCAALAASPHLSPGYDELIFCHARRGDWQTAALTLEAAHALEVVPEFELALLDRFLSPDLFEGEPPLTVSGTPSPLAFRLLEAIGERIPTPSLPRAYANADLRDVAGWKAQLEAAERLTRMGALPPNRLLGLYTERQPAASGGIWDRVRALQRFETALDHNSVDAVAKTLLPVWAAMKSARLEVPFAVLFADSLAELPLTDPAAQRVVWLLLLLSPDYERAAQSPVSESTQDRFLAELAMGTPQSARAPSPMAQAIAEGFATTDGPPGQLGATLADGKLGEAILRAMQTFDRGAQGNPDDLTTAIIALRHVGLEDTARRAALQLMILDRNGQ